MPSLLVREALETGTLAPVLPSWTTAPTPVHVVYPVLRVPSPKTKEMVAILDKHFRPLLGG